MKATKNLTNFSSRSVNKIFINKILIILAMMSITLVIIVNSAPEIEQVKPKETKISYANIVLVESKLVQTEVDRHFPCRMENKNTIVCPAINESKKNEYSSSLGIFDKTELAFFGIPVRNMQGNVIEERRIDWDKGATIEVDLSQKGTFKVGFNSNTFKVSDLSTGVFNQTTELSGDAWLRDGETEGQYFTKVMDLNESSAPVNVSWESVQEGSSDISVACRSYNVSTREGLFEQLIAYLKFDGGAFVDFSGYNLTGTINNNNSPDNGIATPSGRFSSGIDLDGINDFITLENQPIVNSASTEGNLTVSMWVKHENLDGQQTYFSIRVDFNDYHQVRLTSSSGAIRNYQVIGTGDGKNTAPIITDTNWHNLVVVINGTNFQFYNDGVFVDDVTMANPLTAITGNPDIFFGAYTSSASTPFNGKMDEIIVWNRTLNPTEISMLYSQGELKSWSDYTSEITAPQADITLPDGRFQQCRAKFTRTGAEVVHLDSITLGFTEAGAGVVPDNPPEVTLDSPADLASFTVNTTILTCSATDDNNITNMSLYLNATGNIFALNQYVKTTGITANTTLFNVSNSGAGLNAGDYIWNCLAFDNATTPQSDWGTNRTFTISTIECVDADCHPYVCDTDANKCYTTCNSHTQVNSTSYCSSAGIALLGQADTTDCANKEWFGLTDNEVCTSQSTGYCYDDTIGTIGEYCTDDLTGCVDEGVEYTQAQIYCAIANDYYQCLGGENEWSSLTDCTDLGDSYDASATVSGHTYCGYYSAATCSGSGCSSPSTNDCGSFYYTGSTCGTAKVDCDVGCGAVYDSETCNEGIGFTLSADCTTCTVPEEDISPLVTLSSPDNGGTVSTLEVEFSYTVLDDFGIDNCTLWHNFTGIFELNNTNSSTVTFDGSTVNTFKSNFSDNTDYIWNVQCYDNATQFDWGTNRTFSVLTTFVGDLFFEIFSESETTAPIFTVSQSGNTNVSNNLYVMNDIYAENTIIDLDSSGVEIPRLITSSWIDVDDISYSKVRIDNPHNEYIKFAGTGNILLGVFESNPLITTESGTKILFGENLSVTGGASFTDDITITGDAYITEDVIVDGDTYSVDAYITGDINPTTSTDFAGSYALGSGITINSAGDLSISGDFVVDGTFTTAGTSIISADIIPDNDDFYTIGNASHRFAVIYTSRQLNNSGDILLAGNMYTNINGENFFDGSCTAAESFDAMSSVGSVTCQSISIATSQINDDHAGTDITADLEEEAHCSEHDGTDLTCSGEELEITTDAVGDTELDGGFGWTLDTDLNIDSNTLVISQDDDRVGIGTASPEQKLVVAEAGGASQLRLETGRAVSDGTNLATFGVTTTAQDAGHTLLADIRFAVEGGTVNKRGGTIEFFTQADNDPNNRQQRMTIDSDGNVGIGTTSPDRKLVVVNDGAAVVIDAIGYRPTTGNGAFFRANSARGTQAAPKALVIGDNAGTFSAQAYNGSDFQTVGRLRWHIDSNTSGLWGSTIEFLNRDGSGVETVQMVINENGSVGIGTISPEQKLHLNGSGIIRIKIESSDNSARLDIQSPATSASIINFAEPNDGNTGRIVYDFTDEHMRFRVDDAERMRIIANGNMGIGTTKPASDLEIHGTSATTSLLVNRGDLQLNGSNDEISLFQLSTGIIPYIHFRETDSGDDWYIRHGGENFTIGEELNSNHRLTILKGGNVGIGTTSPNNIFEVSGGNISLTGANNHGIELWDNHAAILATSTGASDVELVFYTSTTADSPVEAMRIDDIGNVGIGTDSPEEALHITRTDKATDIRIERIENNMLSGFAVGAIQWYGGEDGSEEQVGAIIIEADGSWSSSSSPTNFAFLVTPSGSTSASKVLEITQEGYLTGGSFSQAKTFTVCGEESVGLVASTYPFSMGNGDIPTAGFVAPAAGTITWMTIGCNTCTTTTTTVEVRKDVTGTNCETDVDQVATVDWGSDIACTDTFTAGQTIRGFVIDDAGTCEGCVMCIGGQFD